MKRTLLSFIAQYNIQLVKYSTRLTPHHTTYLQIRGLLPNPTQPHIKEKHTKIKQSKGSKHDSDNDNKQRNNKWGTASPALLLGCPGIGLFWPRVHVLGSGLSIAPKRKVDGPGSKAQVFPKPLGDGMGPCRAMGHWAGYGQGPGHGTGARDRNQQGGRDISRGSKK